MVAGPRAAIDATAVVAKVRGVRVMRLAVAGAFHSAEMEPAVEPFRQALDAVEIAAPATPVFSCSFARPFAAEPDSIRDALAAALVTPVRWREILNELHRRGVRRFLETGPGKGLTGMVTRAFDDVEAAVLEIPEAAHA